jgi:hypothetical protein
VEFALIKDEMPTNTTGPSIVTGNSADYMTSTTIWVEWNEIYTTSTATNQTVQIRQSTITSSTATSIWTIWNQSYVVVPSICTGASSVGRPTRTPESDAAYATRVNQERVEAEKAKARAEVLLQEALSAKQRAELAQMGFFSLDVNQGGQRRQYRIRRGRSRNVQQVDPVSGVVLKHLCAHPRELVPDADTMLAQKLMLETAEDDFLRIANHS